MSLHPPASRQSHLFYFEQRPGNEKRHWCGQERLRASPSCLSEEKHWLASWLWRWPHQETAELHRRSRCMWYHGPGSHTGWLKQLWDAETSATADVLAWPWALTQTSEASETSGRQESQGSHQLKLVIPNFSKSRRTLKNSHLIVTSWIVSSLNFYLKF